MQALTAPAVPKAALCGGSRLLSVLAWGRNAEGQCGLPNSQGQGLAIEIPTLVPHLPSDGLSRLYAGRLSSAITTADGSLFVWGDHSAGQLGLGLSQPSSSGSQLVPTRVESLAGRAAVQDVALGEQHSLFLDSTGGVWGCGENKEGQCGLGSPLEDASVQQRVLSHGSLQVSSLHGRSNSIVAYAAEQARERLMSQASSRQVSREERLSQYLRAVMSSQPDEEAQRQSTHMGMLMQHHRARQDARWAQGLTSSFARSGGSSGGSSGGEAGEGASSALSALGYGGFDMSGHLGETDLEAGQRHSPTRLGSDLNMVLDPTLSQLLPLHLHPNASLGLDAQSVVSISTGRHYSAAVSADGRVWTFGACNNGCLGSATNSWHSTAKPVESPLADILAAAGGATAVAAAATFCMALTASGKVIVWGKVPEGSGSTPTDGIVNALLSSHPKGDRLLAGEVPGLPAITQIAAGRQHALLSDGERVWAFGRWVGLRQQEVGSAHWSAPQEILHLAQEGVSSISCGATSSGVVGGDGIATTWGWLMDQSLAEKLTRMQRLRQEGITSGLGGAVLGRHGGSSINSSSNSSSNRSSDGHNSGGSSGGSVFAMRNSRGGHGRSRSRGSSSSSGSSSFLGGRGGSFAEGGRFDWAGFGSDAPARLPELGRVKELALGGWHAMALVA